MEGQRRKDGPPTSLPVTKEKAKKKKKKETDKKAKTESGGGKKGRSTTAIQSVVKGCENSRNSELTDGAN